MGMPSAFGDAAEFRRAADTIRRYLVVLGGWELDTGEDLADLESGFVRYAAAYSQLKGLSYRDWREAGVPVDVLTRAGILEFDGSDGITRRGRRP